jgi:hypothetical protein
MASYEEYTSVVPNSLQVFTWERVAGVYHAAESSCFYVLNVLLQSWSFKCECSQHTSLWRTLVVFRLVRRRGQPCPHYHINDAWFYHHEIVSWTMFQQKGQGCQYREEALLVNGGEAVPVPPAGVEPVNVQNGHGLAVFAIGGNL